MIEQAGRRKVRVGRVVSDKMDKTVIVAVERRVHHSLYHKSIRHQTKFQAHDEQNAFRVGDMVRITETRPLSRSKRWRVTDLLERVDLPDALSPEAEVAEQAAAETEASVAVAEQPEAEAAPAESPGPEEEAAPSEESQS
ncbi:MAG: 30S ribosomal protein S17 [Dehalococcoidia bacterium]